MPSMLKRINPQKFNKKPWVLQYWFAEENRENDWFKEEKLNESFKMGVYRTCKSSSRLWEIKASNDRPCF